MYIVIFRVEHLILQNEEQQYFSSFSITAAKSSGIENNKCYEICDLDFIKDNANIHFLELIFILANCSKWYNKAGSQ